MPIRLSEVCACRRACGPPTRHGPLARPSCRSRHQPLHLAAMHCQASSLRAHFFVAVRLLARLAWTTRLSLQRAAASALPAVAMVELSGSSRARSCASAVVAAVRDEQLCAARADGVCDELAVSADRPLAAIRAAAAAVPPTACAVSARADAAARSALHHSALLLPSSVPFH